MKRNNSPLLICFIVLLLLCECAVPVLAENTHSAVMAEDFFSGIIRCQLEKSGADTVQAWIDNALTDSVGVSAEWFVLSLSQSGEYEFASYEAALIKYLSGSEIGAASSRLKYALCLSSVGSTDGYISYALDNSIGRQGIMSWIYGLHLLNNGYVSAEYTVLEVLDTLLSLQHEDGGWSVTGVNGDVDVTAMAVQALSHYYPENIDVKEAVEKALLFLSARQLESGDFTSYGVSNPESAAQVMVALSSLGIDCGSDERFIKNGSTLFDVIGKYRLPDGSFSHKEGGESNGTATVQVLYAAVSYMRMADGKAPLYILDHGDPSDVRPGISYQGQNSAEAPEQGPEKTDGEVPGLSSGGSYKPAVCAIIIVLGGAVCLFLFFTKKRHIKNYIAVLAAVILAVGVVLVTDIRSADEYYNGENIQKDNAIGTVTLAIRCDTVAGVKGAEYIPANGIILDVTEFEIEQGDTVYSILTEAARKYHIQVENDGSAEMAYISGIAYLYEFDFGELSGWVYRVNDISPSVGCSSYVLKDGDKVEWLYTRELGNDLE